MAESEKWTPLPIRTEDGNLLMVRSLATGQEIRYLADGVRPDRTGVHATVYVFLDNDMLDWDTFNVGRSGERTKLVNKAHKRMGELVGGLYSKEAFDHDLDYFCLRVKYADEQTLIAEPVAGKKSKLSFALEPYVADGAGTIMFAPPGSAKSYIGLLMAVSIDSGESKIWKVSQRRVLFINLERSKTSMASRLWFVNLLLGLEPDRELLMINARGKSMNSIAVSAKKMIKDHKVNCTFLDSISRAGGDLNENKDANAVMDTLNGFEGGWFAIGHPPRGDSSHVFGSLMFDAAADLTIQLLSERKGMVTGVGLKMIKFNDIPPRPTQTLALVFDDEGLAGIREPNTGEFPKLEGGRPTNLTDEISEVLSAIEPKTVAEVLNAVMENGSNTKSGASVKTTLNEGQKQGLFRNLAKKGQAGQWIRV